MIYLPQSWGDKTYIYILIWEGPMICTENNFSARSEEGANIQPGMVRDVFTSENRGELLFAGQVEF